jgi:hypothetical protein
VITGSALTRLLNCPSSEVMAKAETHNEWADMGTDEHDELAHATMTGTLTPKRAALVPADPRVEVKLAYDVVSRTARILGAGAADRNYGTPGPFEIFMSLDVLGVDDRDRVIVLDWKTGHGDVEPAATNGQMWGCALAACRALGKSEAIVRLVFTNMGDRCDEHEIDALDLADFANRLERLHVTVAARQASLQRGELLETREGSWCKHCASKHVCPSKNALLVQFADPLVVLGDSVMTKDRVAAAYEEVMRVDALVRDAKKRLEMFVDDNGPIDLGNGRMYGRYVRNGNERLDGAVAVRAIAELVNPEIATEFEAVAVERRTSKAAIERAAKQFLAKRGTVPAIVKRIRELGGATNAPDTLPLGEFHRDRNELAEKAQVDHDAINKLMESA